MRCKNCREVFEKKHFNQKYCTKSECIIVWVNKEKQKDWQAKKKKLKADLMTVQDWVKVAQTHFNNYINQRDKGKLCISCFKPIKGRVNASHYFNANNHWNVRFDEDNVFSSCITCNQYLSGNLINYRKGLIERIGLERFEALESRAKETRKFTVDELKQIIEKYKELKKTL